MAKAGLAPHHIAVAPDLHEDVAAATHLGIAGVDLGHLDEAGVAPDHNSWDINCWYGPALTCIISLVTFEHYYLLLLTLFCL